MTTTTNSRRRFARRDDLGLHFSPLFVVVAVVVVEKEEVAFARSDEYSRFEHRRTRPNVSEEKEETKNDGLEDDVVVVRTEISRDRRGTPNARERVRATSTKTRKANET